MSASYRAASAVKRALATAAPERFTAAGADDPAAASMVSETDVAAAKSKDRTVSGCEVVTRVRFSAASVATRQTCFSAAHVCQPEEHCEADFMRYDATRAVLDQTIVPELF